MTKAVISDVLGPIENYELRSWDPGPPAPGQVQIRVKAAGISFVDVLNAKGLYQTKAAVPFIPGSECAGIVEAVGSDVTGLTVGQNVVAVSHGGVLAERAILPARATHPMPDGWSFEEAAVFMVSATTSWHALIDRGHLETGETLLVLGTGGATGYAAVQIGKIMGAKIIALASSQTKRDLALSAGADIALDTGAPDWRQQVKAFTGGKLANVVFDPVGGDATVEAFKCLCWEGRHLVIGFPAGISSLPTNLPLLRGAGLIGVNVQQLSLNAPDRAAANSKKVFSLASQGHLKPAIAERFALADFADAMRLAETGTTAGRIIVTMA